MNPYLSFLKRVTYKDRALLVREMAIMLSSGVPIVSALHLIAQQTDKEEIRQSLIIIVKDVEDGQSLSVAAARHPKIFDPVTIAILRSGEASGKMHVVLGELAHQLEADVQFMAKITGALVYPGFVIIVMIIVGLLMTTIVIPRLTEVFDSLEAELPLTTQLLIAISNFVINYWYVLLAITVGLFIFLRSYFSTPVGKNTLYALQMRIPTIRSLILNSYLKRFSMTMGMLIHSGVPLTEALRIVVSALPNPVWVQALQIVTQEVERGIPMSTAMSRHVIFPKSLIQMIAVGEQTGKIDSVFDYMAKTYEQQTDEAVKNVTALVGPVVLVIVAVGVAFVVLAVIMPIYGIADAF